MKVFAWYKKIVNYISMSKILKKEIGNQADITRPDLELKGESYIKKIVNDHPEINIRLTEAPQAFILPFDESGHANRDGTQKVLVVWLAFQPTHVTYSNILSTVKQVASDFRNIAVFKYFTGIAIVPFLRKSNGECDRIVRVGIKQEGFQKLGKLTLDDMLREEMVDGIGFTWYWEKEKLSTDV